MEPSAGTIRLGKTNLAGLRGRELRRARRRIGMIFQEYALVERLTVMENVLSGRLGYVPSGVALPDASRATTSRTPTACSIGWACSTTPTSAPMPSPAVNDNVWASHVLAQEPELLLVDEPTASLDPRTSRQIMRLITEICAERDLPAIVNIHDVPLAQQFMHRIVGLRSGEMVFDGAPQKLDDTMLTEIYGAEDWTHAPGTRRRRSRRTGWSTATRGERGMKQARHYPRHWRRPPQIITGRRWRVLLPLAILAYLTLAISSLEVDTARLIDGLERGARFAHGFLQPDFSSRWSDIRQG